MTKYFGDLTLSQVREMVRHEAGHAVVARIQGFPAGKIFLMANRAGHEVNLIPSLTSASDTIEYITKRLKVLYAGVVAQSLDSDNRAHLTKCEGYFRDTASDDFSKIREIMRILVGSSKPGASYSEFAEELKRVEDAISDATVNLVRANAVSIKALTKFFVSKLDEANSPQTMLQTFSLSGPQIDEFLGTVKLQAGSP
jgi:hypothetical protein